MIKRSRTRTIIALATAGVLAVLPLWAAPTDIVSSNPLISAPPDSISVGLGDAEVAGQSGAFTYSYPIVVPPGRLGAEPELALSYSSQQPLYGGIAAGWTLPIPEIRRDWSRGHFAPERWLSSMAGNAELVEVDEPAPADVIATYRAKGDTSYTRYQKMPPSSRHVWQALTSDGVLYQFGDRWSPDFGDWTPLVRTVDPFGNQVDYDWEGVFLPGSPSSADVVDLRLERITYSTNEAAWIGYHARIDFAYDDLQLCAGTPLGATLDVDDGHLRYRGATALRTITTRANNGSGLERVREYTLVYDERALSCRADHAPIRLLTEIRVAGRDPADTVPPVTFAYGDLVRTLSADQRLELAPEMTPAETIGWGRRLHSFGSWSTLEADLMDVDGDARPDHLREESEMGALQCQIRWRQNRENDGVYFVDTKPGTWSSIPQIPWANADPTAPGIDPGSMGPGEDCSLSGQYSLFENLDPNEPGPGCPHGNMGHYNVYRRVHVDTDRIPDLVVALHYDADHYDPYTPAPPKGTPLGAACPVLDEECVEAAQTCTRAGGCVLDQTKLELCLSKAPREPCFTTATRLNPPSSPKRVRGVRMLRDLPAKAIDPGRNQRGNSVIFLDDDPTPPPGGDPPPLDPCTPERTPEATGGRYLWTIYRGLGDGRFDVDNPQQVWAPIPLDNHSGDPVANGGASIQLHALIDIDGDRYLDAIHVGGLQGYWWVWRGDSDGGFVCRDADCTPELWMAPPEAVPSRTLTVDQDGYPIEARQTAGLLDVNNDNRPDYVAVGGGTLRVYYNLGTGFDLTPAELPLGDLPFSLVSLSETAEDFGDQTSGEYVSRLSPLDFDGDGRLDWYRRWGNPDDHLILWNIGGTLGAPVAAPAAKAAAASIDVDDDAWYSERTLTDLDGDGRSDHLTADERTYRSDPRDGARRALLQQIDNGRGLVTRITYSPQSYGKTVSLGDAMLPHPLWVVASVTRSHAHGGAPESRSDYSYSGPVWNKDEDGTFGFRGFESTRSVGPTGAITSSVFDYALDWRGRKVSSAQYADAAAESTDRPSRLVDIEWQRFELFGGALVTYHQIDETAWTCGVGQVTSDCRASGAVKRSPGEWTGLRPNPSADPVLYARTAGWRIDQLGNADEDDVRDLTSHLLYYDEDTYQLRVEREERMAYDPASASWQRPIGRTEHGYDADGRFENETCVFRSDTVAACVQRERDELGNIVAVTKPEQLASGAHTAYEYDSYRLYVTVATNELGHRVETLTDRGSGVPVRTLGPNTKDCGFFCTATEQTVNILDGWGRVIERRESVDDEVFGYRLETVARLGYDDNPAPGQPASITEQQRIDFGSSRFTKTTTFYDGAGRPVEVRQQVDADLSPVTVASYRRDAGGNVVQVTAAAPSANYSTSTETVTHFFEFDSLGRATRHRRPDGSGERLAYDGLIATRTECLPEIADDPTSPCVDSFPADALAATAVTSDVYGRIVRVAERLDDGQWAVTTYEHDGNSAVKTVTSADGAVTEMGRDWSGQAIEIIRGQRVWRYSYDLNDNLVAVTAPGGDPINNTTTMAYDALDRLTSRSPAPLGMSAAEQLELGVGLTVYDYDAGDNGVGRLTSARTVGGGTDLIRTSYQRDARGNPSVERKSFDLGPMGLPHADTREIYRSFNPMGAIASSSHPDGLPGSSSMTQVDLGFDDRGLPATLAVNGAQLARNHRNPAGRVYRREVGPTIRTVAFDQLGRITGDRTEDAAGGLQVEQTFTYGGIDNVVGRVSFVNGTGAPRAMYLDYDSRHQIVAASDDGDYEATFGYTPGGRIARATVAAGPSAFAVHRRDVTYDYSLSPDIEAVDALVGENGASFTYDDAGNTTSKATADGTFGFVYGGEQRLRRVTAPGGLTETYLYDHEGVRAVAISEAGGVAGKVRAWFGETELWYGGSGVQQKSLLHLGMGTPVARLEDQADLEYSVHSAGGHLLAALDGLGQVTTGFHYGPFGEILAGIGETAEHSRRFNGKEHDAIAGLVHYGARYYDPLSLGWTQADPLYRFSPEIALDEPRRMNLYVFSLNNPVQLVDPDGLKPQDVVDNFRVPTAAEWQAAYKLFIKALNDGTEANRMAAVRAVLDMLNVKPKADIIIEPDPDVDAFGYYDATDYEWGEITLSVELFEESMDGPSIDFALFVSTIIHESVHGEQGFWDLINIVRANGSPYALGELQASGIELFLLRHLHAAGLISDKDYAEVRDDIFKYIRENLAKAKRGPTFRNPVLGSIINKKRSTPYYQGLWGMIRNPEFVGNMQ